MGETVSVQFVANSRTYDKGYHLVDGICLKWAIFVKPLTKPKGKQELDFHYAQATTRKDVERAFKILQTQLAIVGGAKFCE
jgi:hypothetical protein